MTAYQLDCGNHIDSGRQALQLDGDPSMKNGGRDNETGSHCTVGEDCELCAPTMVELPIVDW